MPSEIDSSDVKNLLVVEGQAERLRPISMAELGWRERDDLQRWVREHPDLIEPGLLLLGEELADWEGAGGPVLDRLDLLFLDSEGHPLVVELKRGLAPDRSESQALLYAAYCDQLNTTDLVEHYARTHRVGAEEARDAVTTHAPALADDQPGRVRVRLLAEDFPPSVTTTVLFLRDIGSASQTAPFDIGCIKLTAYLLADGAHVLSAQPIIPIPATEAYLVRRRRRQAGDESSRQIRNRVANAVPTLQRVGVIEPGTELHFKLSWLSQSERRAVEELFAREPGWAAVEWTGDASAQRAVRCPLLADEPVSLDAAYQAVRGAAGLRGAPQATHAWTVGDTDKTVRELADEVLAAQA